MASTSLTRCHGTTSGVPRNCSANPTHSLQIYTPGPATSASISVCGFPQNEHERSPDSSSAAIALPSEVIGLILTLVSRQLTMSASCCTRGGSPRARRAWPLAWPSPSGPLGWQRSPGSTARRRRVPRSGMRSTVEAGGASPDNARRSGPVGCDFFAALGAPGASASAWSWCWRARQRDTAGTAGGRSPGPRCAAAAAP